VKFSAGQTADWDTSASEATVRKLGAEESSLVGTAASFGDTD